MRSSNFRIAVLLLRAKSVKNKRSLAILFIALVLSGVGLLTWDLLAFPDYFHAKSNVPFRHEQHGENIGVECGKCHLGAQGGIRAGMPTKADCMDCHHLPLTDSPENTRLEKALAESPDCPFVFESLLPANVVFPHGLHAKAGVSCETCHGSLREIDAGRRPRIQMGECLACHRGERGFSESSTDCARCHR